MLVEDRNNQMGRWEKVLQPLWLCGSHTDMEPQLSELTEMLFSSAREALGCFELVKLMPSWTVTPESTQLFLSGNSQDKEGSGVFCLTYLGFH